MEGFKSLVESVWRKEKIKGNASFHVVKELVVLKAAIKKWVREERVRVEEGINRLVQELDEFDLVEGQVGLNDGGGGDGETRFDKYDVYGGNFLEARGEERVVKGRGS